MARLEIYLGLDPTSVSCFWMIPSAQCKAKRLKETHRWSRHRQWCHTGWSTTLPLFCRCDWSSASVFPESSWQLCWEDLEVRNSPLILSWRAGCVIKARDGQILGLFFTGLVWECLTTFPEDPNLQHTHIHIMYSYFIIWIQFSVSPIYILGDLTVIYLTCVIFISLFLIMPFAPFFSFHPVFLNCSSFSACTMCFTVWHFHSMHLFMDVYTCMFISTRGCVLGLWGIVRWLFNLKHTTVFFTVWGFYTVTVRLHWLFSK